MPNTSREQVFYPSANQIMSVFDVLRTKAKVEHQRGVRDEFISRLLGGLAREATGPQKVEVIGEPLVQKALPRHAPQELSVVEGTYTRVL